MHPSLLHVIAVYENPVRWETRLKLHRLFEDHMIASGVQLTTVECAYGERPFDLDDRPGVTRVRVRSKSMLWHKENLINIGVSRLPPDWKYVAWIDADVFFRKPGWAAETVHALQQYEIVQPWSDAYDLGPKDEHIQAHKSFCRVHWQDQPVVPEGDRFWRFNGGPYDYPHSGYAWAATRQAFEWLGGLIETAIVGHGDHHMALGFVGKMDRSVDGRVSEGYRKPLAIWEARAAHHIRGNLGFIWGTIEHRWHGSKEKRGYVSRWDILANSQFDPATDLKRNSFGVNELAGNKPALQHDIDRYLRSRYEDGNQLG